MISLSTQKAKNLQQQRTEQQQQNAGLTFRVNFKLEPLLR